MTIPDLTALEEGAEMTVPSADGTGFVRRLAPTPGLLVENAELALFVEAERVAEALRLLGYSVFPPAALAPAPVQEP